MIAGQIDIVLAAGIARLQADMDRARQVVGDATSAMSRMAGVAKTALGALAGVLSVSAFAGWVKGAIDAVDAIGDISPATGVAIKDIAGLQLAFQFGGLEAAEFEKTMIKLSGAIAKGDENLAMLGIQTTTAAGALRGSKDVLYDVADAFAEMEDGTRKTALATDIFGKTGAALIPTLNGGAEGLREMAEMAGKLGLSFTKEGVEAAGLFNDSLDTIGLASQGVARQVAMQLLPHLNDLVGSFANLVTEGDGVRKAADVIGTGFKIIYTAGLAVYQVFDTLSSIIAISIGAVLDGFGTVAKSLKYFIEGEYSKAWSAAVNGSRGAVNNIKNLGTDMVDSWSSSATAIAGVWDGSSGKVIEDMARMQHAAQVNAEDAKKLAAEQKKAADAAAKLAAEQARAAQRNAEAYAGLLSAIDDKIFATDREAAGLAALTESQRLSRSLDEQLRSGKLQLTAAETRYYQSLIETLAVNEDIIKVNRERAEEEKEWARIREDVARAQKESADREAEARARDLEAFERTAHDTFVSIQDGGKAAAERLRETFKNGFFEWLYQMTIKKWIINVQTVTTAGGGGLSSLIGAATSGNGVMGAVGNMYSALTGGATIGGGLGTGFLGSLAGGLNGAGVGSGLTSALGLQMGNGIASVLGPTISGALSSGLGAIATAMPWVAGAAAVLAIGKKAFGRGPKETTGTGIIGTFGEDSFSGQAYSEWVKKGGWFRSDKRGTDTSAMDAEMAASLSAAYKGMKDSALSFAQALGLPTDVVTGYSKQIKIAFTGDAAKDQQALADILAQVGEELATRVLPNIGAFVREGETAAVALQRLTVEFQAVGAVMDALGAVGVTSLEARDRLVQLSGGLEAFAAQYEFFNANFLTEAERIAPVQKMVNEQLTALGLAGITTTEQFRDAVHGLAKSGAMATEEGGKTYAGLLALAPAFKQVADYLKQVEQTAIDAAAAAQAAAAAEADRLTGIAEERAGIERKIFDLTHSAAEIVARDRALELAALDETNRAVMRRYYALVDEAEATIAANEAIEKARATAKQAVDTARADVQSAYNAEAGVLQSAITAHQNYAKSIRQFKDSLLMGSNSILSPEARYAEARRQLGEATPENFVAASNAFLEASKAYNGSTEAYARDFELAQRMADQAVSAADSAAMFASAQLSALNQQVQGILEVNKSVQSVREALLAYKAVGGTAGVGAMAGFKPGVPYTGGAMSMLQADGTFLNAIGPGFGRMYTDAEFAAIQAGKFDGSHAGGLDYVPFDGYRAELHKGERVQTAAAARDSDASAAESAKLLREVLDELRAANGQRGAVGTAQITVQERAEKRLASLERKLARAE